MRLRGLTKECVFLTGDGAERLFPSCVPLKALKLAGLDEIAGFLGRGLRVYTTIEGDEARTLDTTLVRTEWII